MKRIGNFKIILWLIIVFLIAGNVGVMKASANTPRVIIENYQIVEGSIEPGGKVILSLQLKNTSNSQDVYNTLLTYANVENMIMSSEKSNQIFVNSIKAGKETTITFELEISKEFSANSIFIDFNLDYVTANGEKLVEELLEANIFAVVIGKTTDNNDKVVLNEEETRFLEPAKADEIYKVNFESA